MSFPAAIMWESLGEVVRAAAFGTGSWADLWRVLYLIGFGVLMWRFAIVALRRKLIN